MKPEYWHCIIGPTDRDKLQVGGDFPMRTAVENAFWRLTGHHEESCWSGWGYDEEHVQILVSVCILNKHDPRFSKIKQILYEDNE